MKAILNGCIKFLFRDSDSLFLSRSRADAQTLGLGNLVEARIESLLIEVPRAST
jgi:hypothetical protein